MDYTLIKALPENKLLIMWNDDNSLEEISANKFSDGEFVITSKKHFSEPGRFTSVADPTYTKKLGWRYGEIYASRNGVKGGSCWWQYENYFEKLSDPMDILYARKITLENSIEYKKERLLELETELETVTKALALIASYAK